MYRMLYVNGRRFTCDCGCNVFQQDGRIYECNACHALYEADISRDFEPVPSRPVVPKTSPESHTAVGRSEAP